MPEPSLTDQVSAWSTFATAVFSALVFILALMTWWTARGALKASREANRQTKHDSIEQTRPYIYAEIVPSLMGSPNLDVRVVNVGKSAARRLTLGYSEWPSALDDVATSVEQFFTTERTLPPGTSIRSMWRLESGEGARFEDGTTEAGLGKSGNISVSYSSDDPSSPAYTDTFDVMIGNSGLWPIPDDGPDGSALPSDLRKFYRLGQTIARHIGELAR
jgi:hypothetical protein